MKIYKIDDPIYMIPLFICVGKLEEFKKFLLKKYNVESSLGKVAGYFLNLEHDSGINHNVIWLPCYIKNNIYDNMALIHECLHAAMSTMGITNVPVTSENYEALAYLQGFYYAKFLELINKVKKRKKK